MKTNKNVAKNTITLSEYHPKNNKNIPISIKPTVSQSLLLFKT